VILRSLSGTGSLANRLPSPPWWGVLVHQWTHDPAADAAYIHLTGERLSRSRTSIPATPPESVQQPHHYA
jgi:hypothetical protein